MAHYISTKDFDSEADAQAYADQMRGQAIPGFSEVYVSGPFRNSVHCAFGTPSIETWTVRVEEFSG
jgi:hypothetical protein